MIRQEHMRPFAAVILSLLCVSVWLGVHCWKRFISRKRSLHMSVRGRPSVRLEIFLVRLAPLRQLGTTSTVARVNGILDLVDASGLA